MLNFPQFYWYDWFLGIKKWYDRFKKRENESGGGKPDAWTFCLDEIYSFF